MDKFYYIVCFILCFSLTNYGQAGKYSEQEVQNERTFVTAKNLFILKKYDESLKQFSLFLKEVPHNASAANEISKIYAVKHDLIEAIEWSKKAVKWDKENEWFRLNLIDLYQENSDFEAGAILFDPLIQKEPTKKYNYEKQGYLYVLAGMPKKALKSYDLYIKNIGTDKSILLKKISLLGGTGNSEEALSLLKVLNTDYPDDENVLLRLGNYYKKNKNNTEAKIYFDKILAINPNNYLAHKGLDELNNKGTSSTSGLDVLISNADINIDIKIKKLFPYLQKLVNGENVDNHIFDLVKKLTIVHPTEAKSHALAGDFSLHKGYLVKALGYYNQALEINTSIYDIWLQKMEILEITGDFATLEKTSSQCLALFPYKAEAALYLGIAQNGLNQPKKAIKNLRPALAMSRKLPEIKASIYIQLGVANFGLNKSTKGWGNFDKAVEISPNNPDILKTYSYFLTLENKDLEKAKMMAKSAVDLAPTNPEYRLNHAFVLYSLKDYAEAKKTIEVLISNGNNNCTVLEPYGDILYQLGDQNQAVIQWQKAFDICPNNKELERKILQKKI